jgi:hypothetical protein
MVRCRIVSRGESDRPEKRITQIAPLAESVPPNTTPDSTKAATLLSNGAPL